MSIFLNPFKKRKILVVEDDNALRRVLCDTLKLDGFKITETSSGQEGLRTALVEHPDLMLPEMDGISLLEEIRKDIWGKTVKVIIMTNLKKGESLDEQTKKYNVADFIEKADISLDEVATKIRAVLK